MYQSLIYKACKLRLRSPLSTTLDVGGPIVLISIYLILKLIISSNNITPTDETIVKPLDVRQDLKKLVCQQVLFFSPKSFQNERQSIIRECDIELVDVVSKEELLDRLGGSLSDRIKYTAADQNLNRDNSSRSACFRLPGEEGYSKQVGIVLVDGRSIEIHSTEALDISVLHQPYSLGSTYNEFRLPHGDLNTGLHLLELCLSRALDNAASSAKNSSSSLKLNIGAFPITADSSVVPVLFMVFQLAGNLCNALATVMRTADDNEIGLHQYVRISGVPASKYWTSHMIVIIVHMSLQSLIFAALLAIPIGVDVLCDPIYETSMTIRWALLLSYALAINAHALFVGSIFERTSHAVLVTCLLAVSYAVYPITFMLQWNPYGFSKYGILTEIAMLNPASNYQALLEVVYAIYFQTNEAFSWSQLGGSIAGGGMSDWTVGSLWLLLLGQTVFWFLATILYDQYQYNSSNNIFGYLFMLLNDLMCCNYLSPRSLSKGNDASKTKSLLQSHYPATSGSKSGLNPNRVCCSLRQVNIVGSTVQVAHTKGDPLKLQPDQLRRLQQINQRYTINKEQQQTAIKSLKYLLKRGSSRPSSAQNDQYRVNSASRSAQEDQPIILDEMLQQHIIWHKSKIMFENLNLDFRFNQVSFILGQTDYKELFFETLLGLRSIQSGQIIIDDTGFGRNTLSLARPLIGFLGEKDIFLNEMTIFENLQFFGTLRDSSYSQYDSESQFILSLLHLTSNKDNLPVLLTNRSARKLALAVAAVGHTKLLLLVEPTLSLRWKPRCQVLNLLKKYKSIRSIIVDTSDIDEAIAVGDRVILFRSSQAYLDGPPQRLAKNLSCGHWIVFEPTGSAIQSNKSTISMDNVKSLDMMTSEIFRQDKLDKLDVTQRSVYEELMKSTIRESGSKSATQEEMKMFERRFANNNNNNYGQQLQRTIAILKVKHSESSNQSLCNLLRVFSASKDRSMYGFRLAEVTYESLEDVIVMNMAKALYPDLPPDLLLSLQHRTQISSHKDRSTQVSIGKWHSKDHNLSQSFIKPIYGSDISTIIRDRFAARPEIYYYSAALMLAVAWLVGALLLLQYSVSLGGSSSRPSWSSSSGNDLSSSSWSRSASSWSWSSVAPISGASKTVDDFYRERVALYIKSGSGGNGSTGAISSQDYVNRWKGSKQFRGIIPADNVSKLVDGAHVSKLVQRTRDQAVAVVIHEPVTKEATIYFEPHQPRALMAALRIFIDYHRSLSSWSSSSSSSSSSPSTSPSPGLINGSQNNNVTSPKLNENYTQSPPLISQHYFKQPWHETIRGYLNRRLAYGLGFAIAEGISIAILILAPLRHRAESKVMRAKIVYWLAMLLFDMTISLAQVICYLFAITIIDGTTQLDLVLSNLLVLLLFKLAMAPVAYLVSMIIISRVNGFFFILLLNASLGWAFSIHMRTLIEWSLISEGYLYTIANWIILSMPISSLIDSLTVINHIGRVDHLCSQVPAYTATSNLIELEGPQRINVVDKLLSKVRECLQNGKAGIPTEVLHPTKFGVIYNVYFLLLFAALIWTFLLFSERVFGLLARRFSSARSTSDPLKTIIRAVEPTHSLFKWDREKDRLVSEFIRCMNEPAYVQTMVKNCVYIRIWLKPMSDQSSIDKRLALILEPLGSLGQPKNDIQIELKTTLQVFVRVGSEANRHKMDRVQLIETYIKFVKDHSDMVLKFALLDWTRESLYKILLHGHYNTKSTSAVT